MRASHVVEPPLAVEAWVLGLAEVCKPANEVVVEDRRTIVHRRDVVHDPNVICQRDEVLFGRIATLLRTVSGYGVQGVYSVPPTALPLRTPHEVAVSQLALVAPTECDT